MAQAKLRTEYFVATGIVTHLNSKGRTMYMDITSHKILFQGQQAVLSLANDITGRILLEEKLVEEKIKKQQEITAAVIIAQAQERTFLGAELHDNINQVLATANLYLECAISDEDSRISLIKDSRQFIKDAIEEIRKLSKTLAPSSLGEVGLREALIDVIEKIKKVNDRIKFRIDWQVPDENAFSEKLKLAIFRIVQEQLNNIFKHAQASTIIISLTQDQEDLRLSIKDDGIGFDTSQKRNGVGLQNIFERANLLKGETSINSKPGAGCELAINFTSRHDVRMSLRLWLRRGE